MPGDGRVTRRWSCWSASRGSRANHRAAPGPPPHRRPHPRARHPVLAAVLLAVLATVLLVRVTETCTGRIWIIRARAAITAASGTHRTRWAPSASTPKISGSTQDSSQISACPTHRASWPPPQQPRSSWASCLRTPAAERERAPPPPSPPARPCHTQAARSRSTTRRQAPTAIHYSW